MIRLTRPGTALASAGFTLLAMGLGMGNLSLLMLGAFPLLLVAFSVALRPTTAARVERRLETSAPRRGEPFTMEVRVAGEGLLEVHAPLPASVLLEEGTNLMLRPGKGDARAIMRLRAHARGGQALPPVTVESIDPVGVVASTMVDGAPAAQLDVLPRTYAIKRLRARMAEGQRIDHEASHLGVDSTDFRELREYAWGDPANAINWKASARRLSALGKRGGRMANPLVNEYEKEGKRTVVVLLDGGPSMRIGTSLETGLDHAVEAAVGTARFFLARGSRVGAATYGSRSAPLAPPEAGAGQSSSIERALAPGEMDPDSTLQLALRLMHPHLAGAKPLIVVVTRITPRSAIELAEGARRVRAITGQRRKRLPLLVLDVRALPLAPTPSTAWESARDLVAQEDEIAARMVEEAGARVVPWQPGVEDLRRALRRGGIA